MKKYNQLFLLSSAVLSVFSAQLTAQASEANSTQKSSNPATLASDITVNVSGNTASINYTRSQTQVPYTIYHAVWSDENGQDDIKWYSAPQTPNQLQLLICVSTLVMEPFTSTPISISMEKWLG